MKQIPNEWLYTDVVSSNTPIDRDRLLDFMSKRKNALYNQMVRDFGGGASGKMYEYMEVKYWIESIQRGEFDVKDIGTINHPFLTPEEAIKNHIPVPNKTIFQVVDEEFRKHGRLGEWVDSGDIE